MTIMQIFENEKALTKRVMETRSNVNKWLEELDTVVNGNGSLGKVNNTMANLDCVVREYERALGAWNEFMEKEVKED